jgi:hypothetical protein
VKLIEPFYPAEAEVFDESHPVPLPASVFAPPPAEVSPPFIDAFGGAMAPRAETKTACYTPLVSGASQFVPVSSTAMGRVATCPTS